jgi:hypothetical protein
MWVRPPPPAPGLNQSSNKVVDTVELHVFRGASLLRAAFGQIKELALTKTIRYSREPQLKTAILLKTPAFRGDILEMRTRAIGRHQAVVGICLGLMLPISIASADSDELQKLGAR